MKIIDDTLKTNGKWSIKRIAGISGFYCAVIYAFVPIFKTDFIVLELHGNQYVIEDGIAAVALFSMFDLAAVDLFEQLQSERPLYIEHRIAKFWKVFWRGFMDTLLSPEKQAEQDAMIAGIIAAANEPMGDDPLRMLAANKFSLFNAEVIANPEGDMYAYNQFRDERRDERDEPEPSGWTRHTDDCE